MNLIVYSLRALLFTFLCAINTLAYSKESPRTQNLLANPHNDQAMQNKAEYNLANLMRRARDKKLHLNKTWHALLHYKPGWWSDYVSQVDDEDFFLSAEGKFNPQAELEATLSAFYSTAVSGKTKQTAQCRFPARFYWLKEQLLFDSATMPVQPCPDLDKFLQRLDAESLSIIFPTSYPNNAASVVGHTLMRINRKGQTPETRMLSYSVNFSAMIEDKNPLLYAANGIGGGYKGYYSVAPYYLNLRKYSKMENRDIWEYALNLSQEQVEFIVRHIYELEASYIDYYFFGENCSYHLLSVLDIIEPQQMFTDQLKPWVIPVDTLKLLKRKNLVKEITYYPSPQASFRHSQKSMSDADRDLVLYISEHGLGTAGEKLAALNIHRRARILDLAYDYERYKNIKNKTTSDQNMSDQERELLLARSRLKVRLPIVKAATPASSPEQGHDTSRFAIGFGGGNNNRSFVELGWRVAYHDFLDPTPGYSLYDQVEMFGVNLRYDRQTKDLYLDNLTLLNITSLSPRDQFFKDWSWRLDTGWKRIYQQNNRRSTVFNLDAGLGLAYAKEWFEQSVVYGFFDVAANYGSSYDGNNLNQWGLSIGMLSDITHRWKLHLTAGQMRDIEGIAPDVRKFSLLQNIMINQNMSLRMTLTHTEILADGQTDTNREAGISLNLYH